MSRSFLTGSIREFSRLGKSLCKKPRVKDRTAFAAIAPSTARPGQVWIAALLDQEVALADRSWHRLLIAGAEQQLIHTISSGAPDRSALSDAPSQSEGSQSANCGKAISKATSNSEQKMNGKAEV